jgi:hypothetical protein
MNGMKNSRGFKKSEKWVEVNKKIFDKFNRDNMIVPFKDVQGYTYYSNASNTGLSKKNVIEKRYYILYTALVLWNPEVEETLKYQSNLLSVDQEYFFSFKAIISDKDNVCFESEEYSEAKTEEEAKQIVRKENEELGYKIVNIELIKKETVKEHSVKINVI